MLSGIRVVDRSEAERVAREERKQQKKERKKHEKKEKQHKHKGSGSKGKQRRAHSDSDSGGGGGGSSGAGERIGGGRRRRQPWDDPSSGGSDGDSQGGDEGGAAPAGEGREDWMTKPMPRSDAAAAARAEERRLEAGAEEEQPDPDKPFVSERELNPYWRDGGSGVPPDKQGKGQQPGSGQPPRRGGGIGDGGASWRLKALKRSQEQASQQGKQLSEVVGERWGSLAQLTDSLSERRAAPAMAHKHSARDRRGADPEWEERQAERRRMREGAEEGGEGEGQERGGAKGGGGKGKDDKAAYLSEVRTGKSQMQRPKEQDSLSWRREDRPRDGGRDSREGGGGRDSREGGGGRDSRDGGRDRDSRGGGGGGAGPQQRHQERRPRGGGRAEDAAALAAAAAEVNAFASDGSFMDSFKQKQQEQQQQGGQQEAEAAPSSSGGEGAPAEPPPPRQQQQQQGRPSAAEAMAMERAALAARAAALPADTAGEAAEGGSGRGRLREEKGAGGRPPAAAAGRAGGGNLSAAAMLRARLTGKAPPPEATIPAAGPAASAAEADARPSSAGTTAAAAAAAEAPAGARHETVALPLIDAKGRAVPGAFGRESAGTGLPEPGRRPKRVQRYEEGQRTRYFADDDTTDLQTLVKRTKHGDEGDIDRNLANSIMRSAKYKEADMNADAEYDHDAGLEAAEGRRGRGNREQQATREKQRQIREYKQHTSALDKCQYCFGSQSRPRHLTVAIGQAAYLALPQRGRLVPGHCLIIPAEHLPSSRQADEAAWTEMRNFKKCLIQMFMKQDREVVFIETAMRLGDPRAHTVIECIPVPPEAAAKAPMYFKKAIDDVTSEWAQHHAKRFIDTRAKGLRGSIPPNFPYFHVEFGISEGFVNVIDDESKFDRSLGRSVMIGLLGLPQEDMHRCARQESAGIQQQWADELRRQFEPYDWTRMLG